jgi:hypothetical protein
MVSFGAIITILTLGFDVFSQQVLTIENKATRLSSSLNSSLAAMRSESYSIATNANDDSCEKYPVPASNRALIPKILFTNIS